MNEQQFAILLLKLDAFLGALDGIEEAIRAKQPPPPSSRPSAGKLPAARGK